MAGFDPAAATAAWLDQIPPAVQAAAERHAEAGVLAWGLGLAGPLILAGVMLRSGAVEAVWRRGARRGAWVATGAVVGLVASVSCAWEALVGLAAGAGAPGFGDFSAAVLARALLFAALLVLLRLAGGRPRLVLGSVAAAASFALVFGPTLIAQLSPPRLDPAPAAVVSAARDLAYRSGVAPGEVGVTPSAPGEGDAVGLFGEVRLLLTPQTAAAGLPEVRAGLGHVLGHYHARDGLGWALLLAVLGVGGVLFAVGLYEVVGRRIASPALPPLGGSAPAGADLADEPAASVAGPPLPASPAFSPQRGESLGVACGLPVLWALASAWVALATPVAFAWDRAVNMRADRFSLEHAREPDGLVQGLIRQNGLNPVDPAPIELWLTCSHPPLKARIDQAMRWKADQAR